MLPNINVKNYINCYNKINKTNYHSILQISKQNLQNVDLHNIRYVSDTFEKNKPSKRKLLKSIYQWYKQLKSNADAFGISQWGLIKSSFHSAPLISAESMFCKMKSQTPLATIPLKKRNSTKTIQATLEKLEFEGGGISYVLKNKGKQLGHLDITKKSDEICIDFMTNILGRKKYRNIENILLQGMVEDCMKQGFIPSIKAEAVNVGDHMGRGYNNRKLYQRMGMELADDGYMRISAENVHEIITKRIEKFGNII